jgi:hypothetical protein
MANAKTASETSNAMRLILPIVITASLYLLSVRRELLGLTHTGRKRAWGSRTLPVVSWFHAKLLISGR